MNKYNRKLDFKSTVADVDVTGATPKTVFEEYGLTDSEEDFKPNFRELILAEDKLIIESKKLTTDLEKLKAERETLVSKIDMEIKRIEKQLAMNKFEREQIVQIIADNFNK